MAAIRLSNSQWLLVVAIAIAAMLGPIASSSAPAGEGLNPTNTGERVLQARARRTLGRVASWASAEPFASLKPGSPGYTTMTRVVPGYKIYHNMWYHNQRWYVMLPPDQVSDPSIDDGLSVNMAAVRTPIHDLEAFENNVRLSYLPGNSLLVDFPFQTFSDNIAHWMEIMVPTYSLFRDQEWLNHTKGDSQHLNNVLLPNLSKHFSSFFTSVFAITLEPASSVESMPNIIDYGGLDSQDKLGWVLIENLVVVTDRYTHPQRKVGFAGSDHGDLWRYDGCDRWISPTFQAGFQRPEHGQEFRAAAYSSEDWDPPVPWVQGTPPSLKRFITFVLPADVENAASIVNRYEVAAMLEEVAEQFGLKARSVMLSNDADFLAHLDTVASSAVLIGRHSPLLAASALMPPGSAVIELLPYKWEWHKMSMLFYNITQSIGDIHHFAWRPTSDKFCEYKEKSDPRYKDWLPSECHARECLQIFARAGLIVDLDALRALLLRKLPGVLAGKSVKELREPWPVAV